MTNPRKHNHYFKDVSKLQTVDVYRVLELFNVADQAIGHAIKKLLVAGGRGVKDISRDVQEAIDTLKRWQEMQTEGVVTEERVDHGITPETAVVAGRTIPAGLGGVVLACLDYSDTVSK